MAIDTEIAVFARLVESAMDARRDHPDEPSPSTALLEAARTISERALKQENLHLDQALLEGGGEETFLDAQRALAAQRAELAGWVLALHEDFYAQLGEDARRWLVTQAFTLLRTPMVGLETLRLMRRRLEKARVRRASQESYLESSPNTATA